MNSPDTPPSLSAADLPAVVRTVLERSQSLGMIGGELDDHIAHAAAFASQWFCDGNDTDSAPQRVADLGSGGGLPALVLAAMWPETEFLLTETRQKRADMLERARRSLGWQDRLTIWAGDVQDAVAQGHRGWADLVTARSFGPPPMVAECAAGLLKTGGRLIVSEPPTGEDRWPAGSLDQLGLRLRSRPSTDGHNFAVIDQADDSPTEFPRRRRTMERKPLW